MSWPVARRRRARIAGQSDPDTRDIVGGRSSRFAVLVKVAARPRTRLTSTPNVVNEHDRTTPVRPRILRLTRSTAHALSGTDVAQAFAWHLIAVLCRPVTTRVLLPGKKEDSVGCEWSPGLTHHC